MVGPKGHTSRPKAQGVEHFVTYFHFGHFTSLRKATRHVLCTKFQSNWTIWNRVDWRICPNLLARAAKTVEALARGSVRQAPVEDWKARLCSPSPLLSRSLLLGSCANNVLNTNVELAWTEKRLLNSQTKWKWRCWLVLLSNCFLISIHTAETLEKST